MYDSNMFESLLTAYRLQTHRVVTPLVAEKVGTARMVDKEIFPVLAGVVAFCGGQ